jgi:hypothetical protein
MRTAEGSRALLQVQYQYGVNTHNMLKELGMNVKFETYRGMAHGVGTSWSCLCWWLWYVCSLRWWCHVLHFIPCMAPH